MKTNRLPEVKKIIGEKFRFQCDFAEAIAVRESKVSRVLCGREILSPKDQGVWAKALGTKREKLFPDPGGALENG